MTAEHEARRTAAAAVVADFQREINAWTRHRAGIKPDMATWAFRLRDYLLSLLAQLDADDAEETFTRPQPHPAAAQLAVVRLLIESFDPEADDALGVLEQVDDVLNGADR